MRLSFTIIGGSALLAATALVQHGEPSKRAHHALVYDETRQRVIMTGGSTPTDSGRSFAFFNDLWEFDGKRWTPRPESGERISGVRLAFDSKLKRVVSFGGFTGQAATGAVRVLDDTGWRTIGLHADMRAAEPGFVYDSKRERFVAFGGSTESRQLHGRTWELQSTTWTEVVGSNTPPARQAHVMVFDEKRGRTVLFGGMGSGPMGQPPPSLGDTWEFDGKSWTQRQVAGPSARNGAGATYDTRRDRVILFGGAGATGFLGDTWSWDGAEWKKLSDVGPPPRAMGYLAYDKARDRVVLFGGRNGYPNGDQNDTWEWDGTTWRRVTTSAARETSPDHPDQL